MDPPQNSSQKEQKLKWAGMKMDCFSFWINLKFKLSGLHQEDLDLRQGDHWQLVVLELVPLQRNEQFDQNRLNHRAGQNLQVDQSQSQLQLYVPVHQKENICKTTNEEICWDK